MWDPPLAQILEETLALKLASYMGVDLKHNCHHLWRKDGRDWDQAVLFFTRFQAMPEEAAVTYRQAAEEVRIHPRLDALTVSKYVILVSLLITHSMLA